MTSKTCLGDLLRERRLACGFSRTRAAELSGVNASSIEAWELGRVAQPRIHDVLRLARALSIPIADVEQAVMQDDRLAGAQESGAARSVETADRVEPGSALPLLERALTSLSWSDDDAAAALNTTPRRVKALRRGTDELTVLEAMALIAVLAAFPSRRGGASKTEVNDLLAQLRGARG